MKTCQSCGLPDYGCDNAGFNFQIAFRAANKFLRDSKRTAWCCSEECAVQTLVTAKYGEVTHRWPISLAEFKKTPECRSFLQGIRSDVTNSPSQPVDSTEAKTPKIHSMRGRYTRKPGRKAKFASNAEKQKAYRERVTNSGHLPSDSESVGRSNI